MLISAEKIIQIRTSAKLTQARFGAKLGVSASAVGNWENGFCDFPTAKTQLLIDSLRVRPEWLETGEGEIFLSPQPPTPREYAKSLGCSDLFADVFASFSMLSDDDKAKFNEALDFILSVVNAASCSVTKNSATGGQSIDIGGNNYGDICQTSRGN
ncbi:MAG: helix-turn-helix transcriptional regulator [Thermoguttaceae bacterium]|nr:helix-turn-helix transcriptional regulator [Thermoguttaceae bacterium]